MASSFSRSYAARGYLARRRRMVDGVALLVDAGGEAALGGDEQMFYTAGDASRSTRCVITSLGDGCLGLCCRLLSGAQPSMYMQKKHASSTQHVEGAS